MKKVLIISYYWPPCGGVGVLRCLKIAKYLRKYGWEPIVFTAKDAHYPSIDNTNLKDLPPNLTVLKQKIWEPYAIYKLMTGKKKDENVNNVFYTKKEKAGLLHNLSVWIRSNFFIPDARAMWISPSVKFLTAYLKENPVDAIISDGPPHSNTRIACLLKKKTGIPWLADFQDPWTQVDYYSLLKLTSWAHKKHSNMEQEVFKHADKITIASPTWKEEIENIGATNVSWFPYGFDPQDFQNLKADPLDKFVLSHMGIVGYDRNPKVLFEVIKELITETAEFSKDIRISFPGQVDHSVAKDIEEIGLMPYTELPGNMDRAAALTRMKNSSVLLLLLNQQDNANGRIPGKVYEYLASRRTILCLGTTEGDCAKIVEDSNAGHAYEYSDKASIKAFIKEQYLIYKSQKSHIDIESNYTSYAVDKLVGDIAQHLDDIISK